MDTKEKNNLYGYKEKTIVYNPRSASFDNWDRCRFVLDTFHNNRILHNSETLLIITARKFAKVMFLHLSVILLTGGGACVVAPGGTCMVAPGGACVVAPGGHAWLLWGGGMCGCCGEGW